MNLVTINIKDLVQSLKNYPIWLSYVIIRDYLDQRYKLDSSIIRGLTSRISEAIYKLTEYEYKSEYTYILHEYYD